MSEAAERPDQDVPPFRYTAALAGEIEQRWQDYWEDHGTFRAPNPVGELADPEHPRAGAPKLYVHGHVPVPVRRRACTSVTRWATSAPTSTPGTSG